MFEWQWQRQRQRTCFVCFEAIGNGMMLVFDTPSAVACALRLRSVERGRLGRRGAGLAFWWWAQRSPW